MRREMKLKYTIITLLALFSVLYFVRADAQTVVHKAKKHAKKGAHKTVAKGHKPLAKKILKPVVKPVARPVTVQKSVAKSLGDEAAKVKVDTTKKGNLPGNSLSEEIVVTTAYKPVLADAVKI